MTEVESIDKKVFEISVPILLSFLIRSRIALVIVTMIVFPSSDRMASPSIVIFSVGDWLLCKENADTSRTVILTVSVNVMFNVPVFKSRM